MTLFNKQSWKYWWQRRTRGWDDSETWDMDVTLSKLITPRLKRYIEIASDFSHPGCVENCDKWTEILNKMVLAFELCADENRSFLMSPEDEQVVEEGLKLFAEYYRGLWW
jgi:hypothetical protein